MKKILFVLFICVLFSVCFIEVKASEDFIIENKNINLIYEGKIDLGFQVYKAFEINSEKFGFISKTAFHEFYFSKPLFENTVLGLFLKLSGNKKYIGYYEIKRDKIDKWKLNSKIHFFDLNGNPVKSLNFNKGIVRMFFYDNKSIIVIQWMKKENLVAESGILIMNPEGKVIRDLPHNFLDSTVEFSSDGKMFAILTSGGSSYENLQGCLFIGNQYGDILFEIPLENRIQSIDPFKTQIIFDELKERIIVSDREKVYFFSYEGTLIKSYKIKYNEDILLDEKYYYLLSRTGILKINKENFNDTKQKEIFKSNTKMDFSGFLRFYSFNDMLLATGRKVEGPNMVNKFIFIIKKDDLSILSKITFPIDVIKSKEGLFSSPQFWYYGKTLIIYLEHQLFLYKMEI